MNLRQDIRDVVAGFTGLFTTQDVIDALPGYRRISVSYAFRTLIYREGIAEKTNPLNLIGVFRVVNNDESYRTAARNAHSISINGKNYDTMVAGCRVKKWGTQSLTAAFVRASNKAGYPVHTITFKKHTVTRSHNY